MGETDAKLTRFEWNKFVSQNQDGDYCHFAIVAFDGEEVTLEHALRPSFF